MICAHSHAFILSPLVALSLTLYEGEERLLQPKLVTGCKMWHLKKESEFFPKANFYAVADSRTLHFACC